MQQRKHDVADELDYFPTPPWATRALCEFIGGPKFLPGTLLSFWPLIPCVDRLARLKVWEPACGEMHMANPLGEYFGSVLATDVHVYTPGQRRLDFLMESDGEETDWLITNPPFNLSLQFVDVALSRARRGVAMLVRSSWLEGARRYWNLFSPRPPSYILQFSERVVMLRGRLIQDGALDPFNLDADGRPRKASSATSYAWVIWVADPAASPNRVTWISDTRHRIVTPARRVLERPGDYPDYSALLAEIEARARAQQSGGPGLFTQEGN